MNINSVLIMSLILLHLLSNTNAIIKSEIQKLTPVISEGRAYFSGVCVEPKDIIIP